jgi:hypothetical protein
VTKSAAALNDATDSIDVTGVATDRAFTIVISGMTGGGRTVVLQRSFDNTHVGDRERQVAGRPTRPRATPTGWTTRSSTTGCCERARHGRHHHPAPPGSPTGSVRGICRWILRLTSTTWRVEILSRSAPPRRHDDWEEGAVVGLPRLAELGGVLRGAPVVGRQGLVRRLGLRRLHQHGRHRRGRRASINRTIGSGPVDTINWLLPLLRLIGGGAGRGVQRALEQPSMSRSRRATST